MNTSVSILFYIKRAKVNSLGVCPIYARVTINAKRFEFSTNKYISPEKWSSEGTKVKGPNKDARTINSHLDYLKNQVLEAEKRLFKKDTLVSTENLKNELFGLAETKRMLRCKFAKSAANTYAVINMFFTLKVYVSKSGFKYLVFNTLLLVNQFVFE
jgi:hypothetical protein